MKPVVLVLDDLMFDKSKLNHDSQFKRLILNGRHYNVTVLILCQYVKHLSPELRANIDLVFSTYQKNPEQRKKMRVEFDVGFQNERVFHEAMRRCTIDWGVMVLEKRSLGRNGLCDSVFHFKATINRKFRLGSNVLWDLHDAKFNPEFYESSDEEGNREEVPIIVRKVRNNRKLYLL